MPADFSCIAPTGPYNPNFNTTNSLGTYTDSTRLANQAALEACCTTPILPYDTSNCHSYCTGKDSEESLTMQKCISEYISQHPDDSFPGLVCDEKSGATMLRRTSGWGGLAILGLVVSAAVL